LRSHTTPLIIVLVYLVKREPKLPFVLWLVFPTSVVWYQLSMLNPLSEVARPCIASVVKPSSSFHLNISSHSIGQRCSLMLEWAGMDWLRFDQTLEDVSSLFKRVIQFAVGYLSAT
jgi:hypothetical protein